MLLQEFRHFVGRAKLSGMFTWFPAGFLGVIFGICLLVHARSNLTPYSVSVRGYYRSDGTYVRAHKRRPPGSVKHDKPYNNLQFISCFFLLVGITASGIPVYRLVKLSDWQLLPDVKYESKLPEKPRHISIPHVFSKARKSWLCCKCTKPIRPGESYYHYGKSQRTRFCLQCRLKLIEDKNDEDRKRIAYNEALRKEKADIRAMQIDMYKHFYGIQPREVSDLL